MVGQTIHGHTAPLASYPIVRALWQPMERATVREVPDYVWKMAEMTEAQLLRVAVQSIPSEITGQLEAVMTDDREDFVAAIGAAIEESTDRLTAKLEDIEDVLIVGFSSVVASLDRLAEVVEAGFANLTRLQHAELEILERIEAALVAPLEVRSKERRQRALKAYSRGMLAEAKADLLAAVEDNVYDHIAWQHLGHIALREKEYEESLGFYEKAARYALAPPPGDPERAAAIGALALVGGARTLQHLEDYPRAMERAERAVEVDGARAEGWYELGRAAVMQGKGGLAVSAFRETLVLEPTYFGAVAALEPTEWADKAMRRALLQVSRRRDELLEAMNKLRKLIQNADPRFADKLDRDVTRDMSKVRARNVDNLGSLVAYVRALRNVLISTVTSLRRDAVRLNAQGVVRTLDDFESFNQKLLRGAG